MKKISNYYIVSTDEILKRFSDKPDPIAHLEKELTVLPKAFGSDKPEPMITYKKEDGLYYVPFRWGIDTFGGAKEGLVSEDTSLGYPIDIKLNKGVSPRKEQIEPLEHCKYHLEHTNRFLLEALPSWGKTFGSIYMMCQLKVSVAVIVGKSALIDQWREAIKQFTNLTDDDIGLVKADDFIYKNKAVTLISTDSFYDREFDNDFLNNFGAIFMDEVHNFNAQQKFQAIGKFYAKYQMGMSATHDRTDGRDKVSELWFGEIAVVAGNADPVPIKVVVVPVKHDKPLNVNYEYFRREGIDPKWSEISKLSELPFRNKTILDLVEREYNRGGHIICVSDRIQQLQYMYDEMLKLGIPEEELGMAARSYYTGHYKVSLKIDVVDIEKHRESIKSFSDEVKYTLSKSKIAGRGFKTRKEANDFIQHVEKITPVLNVNSVEKEKKSLKDKEVSDILYDRNRKVVFSSYGLLKEGVSIWWKNRLFDLTPQSRAEQLLGRIGRKAEDGEEKEPAVAYTMWDYGHISKRIKRTHQNRKRNYMKMDYVTLVRAK